MNRLLPMLLLLVLACAERKSSNLFKKQLNDEVVKIVLRKYGLEEIPSDIGDLRKVKQLTISMDSLKGWVIFPPMSALMIHVSRPPFYSLPAEITQLKNLEKLTIIDLNISSLPEDFEQLQNLEYLDLSMNKLTLSDEVEKIVRLKKLKTLSLFGNKIDSASLQFVKQERPDIQLIGLEDFAPTN